MRKLLGWLWRRREIGPTGHVLEVEADRIRVRVGTLEVDRVWGVTIRIEAGDPAHVSLDVHPL